MNIQMRGKTAEVLLYEDIGGFFGITADMFIKEIKQLDASTINLRINSNGGNVFDGIAIYNYLKSAKQRVEVDIDGVAASIASIIAMSGDEIRMAENGWMMIHDPWIVTGGTSEELRKTADTMDGIRQSLLDTYVSRTGGDAEQISNMMREETWLNAKDAAELGFVDQTVESMAVAAHVHKDWFKNIPEPLAKDKSVDHVEVIEEEPVVRTESQQNAIDRIARINNVARRYKL